MHSIHDYAFVYIQSLSCVRAIVCHCVFFHHVFCARCPNVAATSWRVRNARARTTQAVVVAPLKKVSLCLITVSLRQASALTSPLFHTLIYTDCAAKIDRLASVSCCFDERTNYSGSQVSFRSGTSF